MLFFYVIIFPLARIMETTPIEATYGKWQSLLAKVLRNHKEEDCPAELLSSAAQYYFIKYNKVLFS